MNATTKPRYRMIGTTDDVIDCDKCGKHDLRMTVVLEHLDADGNPEGDIAYYGSTCAARALAARGIRRSTADLRREATAAERQRQHARKHAQQMVDFYSIPADRDLLPGSEEWHRAVLLFQQHNPSIGGLRPYADCERFLSEGIARWRAALAG